MKPNATIYTGGRLFDGATLYEGHSLLLHEGKVAALKPEIDITDHVQAVDLDGDIVSPGYVDLQVNGGGGLMFNDDPCADTLTQIAQAHRRLGVVRLLPTLITDTPMKTTAAISAATQAISADVRGIAGLHLEGPHLSIARKGAHDATYIRAMTDNDVQELIAAKAALPILKVTLAPENVTTTQVSDLSAAGILVSLGHTDAPFDTCLAYADAGATCVTHLFNAMSQMGNRAPGLVGAALHCPSLNAGLIADGIHVHPAVMRAAWASKTGPGRVFLVSDAMAVAGTDLQSFELDGRRIERRAGQLRLSDGTLAGADLDLTGAVANLVHEVGLPLDTALAAATRVPADVIGLPMCGSMEVGTLATDLIRISSDLTSAMPLA